MENFGPNHDFPGIHSWSKYITTFASTLYFSESEQWCSDEITIDSEVYFTKNAIFISLIHFTGETSDYE